MKRFFALGIGILLVLFITSCGKATEQPTTQPITANIEPQKGEVEQIAKQLPPVEQPKEQPAPQPSVKPVPKVVPPPAPTSKNLPNQSSGPIKPITFVKNTVSAPPTPKVISTVKLEGTVHSLDGLKLDRGTIQTVQGKQYKFYNMTGLGLGDKVQFQLDGNYIAVNLKVIEEQRTQTNLTR